MGFISQSLKLRSIVLGWILIYQNWSVPSKRFKQICYMKMNPSISNSKGEQKIVQNNGSLKEPIVKDWCENPRGMVSSTKYCGEFETTKFELVGFNSIENLHNLGIGDNIYNTFILGTFQYTESTSIFSLS